MKKSGQALFLSLLMLAGARYSVATDAAGLAQETQRRTDRTLGDGNKTDEQSKKQPGYFNRCTRYAHDMVTSVQKHRATVGAAAALAGLLWIYGPSGESKVGRNQMAGRDTSSSKILVEVEVNDQADVNGGEIQTVGGDTSSSEISVKPPVGVNGVGNQMDGGESKGLGNVTPYSNYRPICNAIVDYFLSDSTGEFRDQNQRKMDVIDGLANSEAYIGGENPGGQFNNFEYLTDLLNNNIRNVELSQSSWSPIYYAVGIPALLAMWKWKKSRDVAAENQKKLLDAQEEQAEKDGIALEEVERQKEARIDLEQEKEDADLEQKKLQADQAEKAEKDRIALEEVERQKEARIEEAAMIVKESVTSIVQGAIEKAQEDEEAKIAAEKIAREKEMKEPQDALELKNFVDTLKSTQGENIISAYLKITHQLTEEVNPLKKGEKREQDSKILKEVYYVILAHVAYKLPNLITAYNNAYAAIKKCISARMNGDDLLEAHLKNFNENNNTRKKLYNQILYMLFSVKDNNPIPSIPDKNAFDIFIKEMKPKELKFNLLVHMDRLVDSTNLFFSDIEQKLNNGNLSAVNDCLKEHSVCFTLNDKRHKELVNQLENTEVTERDKILDEFKKYNAKASQYTLEKITEIKKRIRELKKMRKKEKRETLIQSKQLLFSQNRIPRS